MRFAYIHERASTLQKTTETTVNEQAKTEKPADIQAHLPSRRVFLAKQKSVSFCLYATEQILSEYS